MQFWKNFLALHFSVCKIKSEKSGLMIASDTKFSIDFSIIAEQKLQHKSLILTMKWQTKYSRKHAKARTLTQTKCPTWIQPTKHTHSVSQRKRKRESCHLFEFIPFQSQNSEPTTHTQSDDASPWRRQWQTWRWTAPVTFSFEEQPTRFSFSGVASFLHRHWYSLFPCPMVFSFPWPSPQPPSSFPFKTFSAVNLSSDFSFAVPPPLSKTLP